MLLGLLASWPCAATSRLLRSSCSRCAGRLSRCRGAFPYRSLTPPDLLRRCPGQVKAGRELGSWRLPLAPADALYRFGALLRGSPPPVPRAVPSGCVRCRGVTYADPFTHASGSCAIHRSKGSSTAGPGLFFVGTDNTLLGGDVLRQGSVCVCGFSLLLAGSSTLASREILGLPYLSGARSPRLVCALGLMRAGVPLFLFVFLFSSMPQHCLRLAFFFGPGRDGPSRRMVAPSPLLPFFAACFPAPSVALVFSGFGPLLPSDCAPLGWPPPLMGPFFLRLSLSCSVMSCRGVLVVPCCGGWLVVGSSVVLPSSLLSL